jgi:hypothetical protein
MHVLIRDVIVPIRCNHADTSGAGSLDVAENTSADLQDLIDRLRGGDLEARRELLQRAYDQLLRIAAAVYHETFPALRGRHDMESVVSELWMRLVGALEATQPQTFEGFFGLVFPKVRQVLLEMASRQRRADRRPAGPVDPADWPELKDFDRADTTNDPGRLAALSELHAQIKKCLFSKICGCVAARVIARGCDTRNCVAQKGLL